MTEQRHAGGDSLYGYCTEALISGDSLDIVAARDHLLALGDSVLVVGDQRLMRVHVHTDDPGRVLSHGTSLGNLLQVKVDNIRKQAEGFVEMHEDRRAVAPDAAAFSSVAVVAGEGMAGVFASVGCTRTVSGGPTMNPSAQEILDAIEACPCWDVVVLPNDRNVVLAAEQAAALTDKRVRVVACRSMPEGLAALLAASPDEGLDANVDAMKEALSSVHTVEVTRAVRSTRMGGLEVRFGQAIGILDGELIVAAASPEEAAIQTVAAATGDDRSLITVYFGGDAGEDGATALAARLRERFSAYDVEVVYGGQPNYDYIISVE